MWRVNLDGKISDAERKLTHIFPMEEADFFRDYADLKKGEKSNSYAVQWQSEYSDIIKKCRNSLSAMSG